MKTQAIFFSVLLVLFTSTSLAKEQQKLYIGIEKNRIPYTDLDKTKQAQGILVSAVRELCDDIDAECVFVSGQFDALLKKLQTYQLNGVILIENLVLPELDKIQTLQPLCKKQLVFVQKIDINTPQKEGFTGKTIGVLESSLTHLYLLDEYSENAQLKPYPLLESGVFDLVMDRIDVLAVNLSFFKQRVQNTHLGKNIIAKQMLAHTESHQGPADTSMTLALRESDNDLYERMRKAQDNRGSPSYCSNLIIGRPGSPKVPVPAPPIDFISNISSTHSGSPEPQTTTEENTQ